MINLRVQLDEKHYIKKINDFLELIVLLDTFETLSHFIFKQSMNYQIIGINNC